MTGYGLAAAEILRLREHKIKVTASVDQVAASGGYMMACAADRIVAAPFAVVGSIGVVAPVPNLHRLLQKNEIDFEEMTAGEFKRSVSVLGEITPAGREHFRGKLDATHGRSRATFKQCRPNVDIDEVANGDHWLAREALGLGLVDELSTGDELFVSRPRGRAPLRSLDRSAKDAAAADSQRLRRRRAIRGRAVSPYEGASFGQGCAAKFVLRGERRRKSPPDVTAAALRAYGGCGLHRPAARTRIAA